MQKLIIIKTLKSFGLAKLQSKFKTWQLSFESLIFLHSSIDVPLKLGGRLHQKSLFAAYEECKNIIYYVVYHIYRKYVLEKIVPLKDHKS